MKDLRKLLTAKMITKHTKEIKEIVNGDIKDDKRILDYLEFMPTIKKDKIFICETRDYDLEDIYTKKEFRKFIDKLEDIYKQMSS